MFRIFYVIFQNVDALNVNHEVITEPMTGISEIGERLRLGNYFRNILAFHMFHPLHNSLFTVVTQSKKVNKIPLISRLWIIRVYLRLFLS